MGKVKSSKSSDHSRKTNTKKRNPFEVHINKEKFKILGKKSKNDRGIPGVSREKALNKRKNTLQIEYKLQHKVNKFLDKRIGEGNQNMTEETKFTARYAKLKAKKHKKSLFNLADEEILTHRGQTLSEIEKFENVKSDDEDSLDGKSTGKLDSDFVEEAHFGGGILKRTSIDGFKSHKDLINQLIAESKARKEEKQKIKEQTLELTDKLDDEWKDLLPLIHKTSRAERDAAKEKSDEYDIVMRQLKFEARGNPSDRLKSENEIAKEEKEKLETLEEERQSRMRGVSKANMKKKHMSADDLDDNFAYDSDQDVTLSYNTEGLANVTVEAELNGKVINTKQEDTNDENTDDEQDSEENNDETIDNQQDFEENNDEEMDEDSESDDSLSEFKENASQSSDSDEDDETNKFPEGQESKNVNSDVNEQTGKTIRDNLLLQKDIMEKARQELPYTFKIPDNYEDFQALLQDESSERQDVIIERMIKCNHPSLGENNKENLSMVFAYILQYINDLSYNAIDNNTINSCFRIYSHLVPYIFDLAQVNQENAHKSILEVIKEKQLEYRKRKSSYPGIDTLLFLKLVSCLFPTSDFRHMDVTPSIVFIDQMLNNCKVRTRKDISSGLFLTTLVLEYTTLSQRFLPSAMNFLAGILHMCIPKAGIRLHKIPPPFKSLSNTLVLFNNYENSNLKENMNFNYLLDGEIEDEYKITAYYVTVSLLEEFFDNFKHLQANYEIFSRIKNYLNLIPLDNYPEKVREKSNLLINNIKDLTTNRSLVYLVVNKRRPKALRLYDPNVQKIFDTKKHKVQSKEKAERAKLLHKLKNEKKGALREIRRDKAFLARLKLDERLQSDTERRDKVNKLLSEASIQQSEFNKMDRTKRKK